MEFTLKNKEGTVMPLDFVPTEVNLVATNHEGHTILISDVTITTNQINTTGKGTLSFKTNEQDDCSRADINDLYAVRLP